MNNRRARYYRLTAAGRKQLGLVESSFTRLIEAIARVLPARRAATIDPVLALRSE